MTSLLAFGLRQLLSHTCHGCTHVSGLATFQPVDLNDGILPRITCSQDFIKLYICRYGRSERGSMWHSSRTEEGALTCVFYQFTLSPPKLIWLSSHLQSINTQPNSHHLDMALQCCSKCAKHNTDDEFRNEHGTILTAKRWLFHSDIRSDSLNILHFRL